MKAKSELRRDTGISLLETLVALSLGLIILSSAFEFFVSQVETNTTQRQVARMQQNGRVALDVMLREIRMAGYDPTDDADSGFTAAQVNQLTFTQDLNSDGDVTDGGESISYSVADADYDGDLDLMRTEGGQAPEIVTHDVDGLAFSYRLKDGTVSTAPSDLSQIRAVKVDLTARTAIRDRHYAQNGGYHNMTFSRTAVLPNMRLRD